MSRGGYTGASSYTGSGITSPVNSGSSWAGSSSSPSFSGPDYISSSSSVSSCNHKCKMGWGIGIGVFVFICGGWTIVVYGPFIVFALLKMFCKWLRKTGPRWWMRFKKGAVRIQGWLLLPIHYWYGVRQQERKTRKTVAADGLETEVGGQLWLPGTVTAGENVDEKGGLSDSDKTLVEGASLWARVCRFTAGPFHLLRKVRGCQKTEVDLEKNEIDPVSTQSHLVAHFRWRKEHPPRVLSAVSSGQETPHSASYTGNEIVATVVSPSFAKKNFLPCRDTLKEVDGKRGSIGSDRTLAKRPSMWRRIYSFVSFFRRPQSLASDEDYPEKDFKKDLDNHKQKDASSTASSTTLNGSSDEKASKESAITQPKPVHTALTNCRRE